METLEGTDLCFPQFLNTSCRKIQQPQLTRIFIFVLLSCISALTVILNLLVIISISHFKQLHTPTNFLMLSLAVPDFLTGFLMILQILQIDGCWFLGEIACAVYYFMDYTITSVSIGTMVLISVDRYVAICKPLHYSTVVIQKRLQICVTLCWTCSAIFHGVRFQDNLKQPGRYDTCYGQCVVVVSYAAGVADLFFSFLGPISVIITLYIQVFVVVVSQARAMRSHVASVTLHCSLKVSTMKSEIKAAITLGVVVVVFLICICPYFCYVLAGQETLVGISSTFLIISLFYLNSFLNPLIYALFYSWFRKSVRLIITLKILQIENRNISLELPP